MDKLKRVGITLRSVLAGALALACLDPAAAADPFPTRPIRIVVPVAAGGWGDTTTRLVAPGMSEKLGQPVIIENRTGAGGQIGIRFVKTAPADGYTLVSTGATLAISAALKREPGYDPLKDFVEVGSMARSPAILVLGSAQPEKTLADLIAQAKAHPNKLSYASAGTGTTTHIAAEMFLRESGLKMLHVPYKGNGAAMPDVVGGRINMIFDAFGSSASLLKGGQLRALGVTSTARLPALPDVPTIAEQGVPRFSYYYWLGLFAPAGTPKEVTQRLQDALRSALTSSALRDRLQADGTEPLLMATEEFKEFVRQEVINTNKLVAELGLPKE
jgi:tripartite-type tricarboxylate transporter receptor subunit TctC